MPKSKKGNRRSGGGGNNWSMAPNPWQIPEDLADAIGMKGLARSIADAQFDSNPHYSDQWDEFSKNCQRVVMAFEMQRRGYDVEALPTYQGDQMPYSGNWKGALSGMTEYYAGSKTVKEAFAKVDAKMAEWGEGARGIVRVGWGNGSGHVFNVERFAGKTRYIDAQDSGRDITAHFSSVAPSTVVLFRTDTATITDQMRHMVKPRGV